MEGGDQSISCTSLGLGTPFPEYGAFNNLDRWNDLPNATSSSPQEDQLVGISSGDSFVSMLCLSGAKLIPYGLKEIACTDELVLFLNAGGAQLKGKDSYIAIEGDSCFEGGDVLRTVETINDAGCYPSLYQSARFGNFSYKFDGLDPGEYFIDLHFAEIINTHGPKGMRIFDVLIQEEKVLNEVDIYAVVGANKPLQFADIKVYVDTSGVILIRFKGVCGSPIICGICIRKASGPLASLAKLGNLTCNKRASLVGVSPTQNKSQSPRTVASYERKIVELSNQCQLKSNECYEAWMLLTEANEKLEKLRMELDTKLFQAATLDQAMEKQTGKLRDVSERYQQDKKVWVAAIKHLEVKVKLMKEEHRQLSLNAHECANSIPELNKMITGVKALVEQCEELKQKYSEEQAKRKVLYNQVQETKGNIRVFCRCRPLNKQEVSSGYSLVVDFEAAKEGDLGLKVGGATKKTFKFDRVYTPKEDQVDVFADALPLVTSVLDGYNVCIFAYGQTGTGKTFTMEGTRENRGVNYRTLEELFKLVKEREDTVSYNISVSVLEVYNEQIRDLLATSPSSKKLEIKQAAEGVHHVPGVVEAEVADVREVWDVLQAGSNARAVGSNNVNEHSSRSHCMLNIIVRAKNLVNGECTKSKLWLVDLAGSERLAKTDVQGERLKEALNINRSLSAFGDVISALATKSSHIPYRNSKLTHLLQDSLGGDSKTLMFVQISPSENDLGETLSSLNFATRVRGIELCPAKKQIDIGELQKTKHMLEKAKQDARFKDDTLRKVEENYQNLESKLRGKDQLCRNLQEKVKELEELLQSKTNSQNQIERQYLQNSATLEEKEEMCMTFKQKVNELENKLKEQQNYDSMIQHKIMELENKLRERDRSEFAAFVHSAGSVRIATPTEAKCTSECESTNDIDPQILRSSNSICRPMPMGDQESVLLRGIESLQEIKRKRDHRNGGSTTAGELENTNIAPYSLVEKKVLLNDTTSRHKQIDSVKVYGRFTRKPKVPAIQKSFPHNRINKEQQVGGTKERDKARGWLM